MGGADSFRNIQQNFKIANSVCGGIRFLSPSLRGEFLSKGCLHSHAREDHCTHKYRGVSLDFPALPNAIELCAVTLRWFRTNQRVLITRFEKAAPLSTRLQLFSSCIQGSSESVQEFAARINKLGTQIFQSGNSAQNTAVRNANDQLLQSRFISGLRNDIRRFVLARDPINLYESISAALIEEQNVKLNQIANDERSGLSPSQTETSVISALKNKLEEINLRVERLQEASSVTVRKTGGDLFNRRETVFKCFYCGFQGHRQAECRKTRMDERRANYQPPEERRGRIFCFPSPKHSFFRSATCPFPRIGFSPR
ncbi:hypothetical protein TNCV_370311 [Trichonephila clavipes]|nr:hypothetical protein TNCV_370311 [Trichonephila clavipes]